MPRDSNEREHRPPGLLRQNASPVLPLEVIFWLCVALILWTQLGYGLALAILARVRPSAAVGPRERAQRSPARGGADPMLPSLSLIIAAHDEQSVIEATVESALSLDYPRERLELIVACDGCGDETAMRAR